MKQISIIIGVVVVAIIAILLIKVSYNNKEIRLRKQIEAEQVVYEQNFDKMYKIIAQTAEVAERNVEVNREAIKTIYPDLIEGRYSQGDGTLMKWIQENNPTWDMQAISETYNKIMAVIEAQREGLYTQAKRLRDLVRERETLIEQWPGSWFVSNQEKIEITLISSKHTKEVFQTGEDNDINLFKKPE
ncbi:MAG: hypothetical protein LBI53_08140 [Candidatus Peribacteria bacterium]|jgi:mannitol-specific phosphotransferase system IIBC component|nr:hypothetical protein [Candidatus Peribacteria bacterium]